MADIGVTQSPSLPRIGATTWLWNLAALVAGAMAYLLVIYRLQTYSQRNNTPGSTYELFAAIMFLLGFGAGLVAVSRVKAATLLIMGVWLAHAFIIDIDWREDPTNHNLLPFEFIYLFILGAPAYLGAWLSRFVRDR